MAFGLAPRDSADGIVATLTGEQAAIAVVASDGIFVQSQDRPTGCHTEQRSQRTDGAAPEAGDAIVQGHEEDKEKTQEETLAEVRLLETQDDGAQEPVRRALPAICNGAKPMCSTALSRGVHGVIQARENREAERTHEQ